MFQGSWLLVSNHLWNRNFILTRILYIQDGVLCLYDSTKISKTENISSIDHGEVFACESASFSCVY